MPNVTARIKIEGKQYEISVDVDEALKIKNGAGDITKALNSQAVFYDLDKGTHASKADLESAFGTNQLYEIAEKIIKDGIVQKPQEYRDAEREAKIKQVISLVIKNAVDQNDRPYTEERIRRAVSEVHYNFDNRPAEQQMNDLIHKLKTVIPIRVETKKIRLRIPARYTGQVYGVLKDYKENEDWMANGDLEAVVNVPAGMQIDFYDKLNSVTHGAVVSEEIRE